ncbi:MAG: hypothetical protein ABSG43_27095, partial [Solirubrobacteraceae bacterium]
MFPDCSRRRRRSRDEHQGAGFGVCGFVKTVYEFDARLVGCPGVRGTIRVRSDQTFVHLHRALQLAFGWDDDHLYTFWLGTKFWPRAGT